MKTLKTEISWIDETIPEGLPLKSTTVITGPGGSGKPLIGETFVSAWLKKAEVLFLCHFNILVQNLLPKA